MKINYLTVLMSFLFLILISSCASLKNLNETNPINLYDESGQLSFTFQADYTIPASPHFQARHLTGDYDVKISNDTIYSHLPYFGEAFYAEYGSTKSPLSFVSNQFLYEIVRYDKKGMTSINLQISDQRFPIYYHFTIFDNGKTDLVVRDQARKNITFQGTTIDNIK